MIEIFHSGKLEVIQILSLSLKNRLFDIAFVAVSNVILKNQFQLHSYFRSLMIEPISKKLDVV